MEIMSTHFREGYLTTNLMHQTSFFLHKNKKTVVIGQDAELCKTVWMLKGKKNTVLVRN